MKANRGAIGLAMVAVIVACALLAPAAQAEETPLFRAEISPVNEKGTQSEQHVISVNAGTLKCAKVNLVDNGGNGGMALLMEPTYTECLVNGVAATVKMNGCKYEFEPIKKIEADRYSGRMGVVCPVGGKIEVATGFCLVTIEGQANKETVQIIDNTKAEPAKDETWKTEVKGVKYTQNAFCTGGAGTFENLSYTGSETIQGTTEAGLPDGLWVE